MGVDIATHTLAQNLSTDNVVGRLVTCEEFALSSMFKLIGDELIENPKALNEVANNLELLKHPRLLQSLLTLASARYRPVCDTDESASQASPPKRRRIDEKKADSATGGA